VIGFTCNASALPDADRLAHYTREAFAELERTSRSAGASGRTSATRAKPRPRASRA
jgi:hypothetical protein